MFDSKADFVVVPGTEGELGILARHASLLTALKKGSLRIKVDSEEKKIAIQEGFLEVNKQGVFILVETEEELQNTESLN